IVSSTLLEMWRHLKHQTPGTSERKFVQTLSEISKTSHRWATIDRKLFGLASRQYDHFFFLLNTEVNGMELFRCLACGPCPLAIHVDGNIKLYRWLSALGVDVPSLFGDVGIVDTLKFLDFVAKVNAAKIPRGSSSKDSCGSAEYKAGKADSSQKKGLAETGMVFCTCRHGVLWRALDMDKGESYRHILYLHDFALQQKLKFFCYDVVCNYWPFAKDVGTKLETEDFKKHTEKMVPFLSRFHGKTHKMFCQLLYGGHWMTGAASTTGETTEQSNSKMSRYGSTT
ncbi:Uncharacterized protein APZ42_001435, partial [Daphnia magna]